MKSRIHFSLVLLILLGVSAISEGSKIIEKPSLQKEGSPSLQEESQILNQPLHQQQEVTTNHYQQEQAVEQEIKKLSDSYKQKKSTQSSTVFKNFREGVANRFGQAKSFVAESYHNNYKKTLLCGVLSFFLFLIGLQALINFVFGKLQPSSHSGYGHDEDNCYLKLRLDQKLDYSINSQRGYDSNTLLMEQENMPLNQDSSFSMSEKHTIPFSSTQEIKNKFYKYLNEKGAVKELKTSSVQKKKDKKSKKEHVSKSLCDFGTPSRRSNSQKKINKSMSGIRTPPVNEDLQLPVYESENFNHFHVSYLDQLNTSGGVETISERESDQSIHEESVDLEQPGFLKPQSFMEDNSEKESLLGGGNQQQQESINLNPVSQALSLMEDLKRKLKERSERLAAKDDFQIQEDL